MSPVLTLTFLINDTATPEIYTLSLHDALPIYERTPGSQSRRLACSARRRHRIPGPKGLEFRGRENSRRSPSRLERTRSDRSPQGLGGPRFQRAFSWTARLEGWWKGPQRELREER